MHEFISLFILIYITFSRKFFDNNDIALSSTIYVCIKAPSLQDLVTNRQSEAETGEINRS